MRSRVNYAGRRSTRPSSSTFDRPFSGSLSIVINATHETGWFGPFGGRFVSETLIPALDELALAAKDIASSESFKAELRMLLASYVGRPTPLTEAARLARTIDPSGKTLMRLFMKREDLCHTGAHKINNALGQVL